VCVLTHVCACVRVFMFMFLIIVPSRREIKVFALIIIVYRSGERKFNARFLTLPRDIYNIIYLYIYYIRTRLTRRICIYIRLKVRWFLFFMVDAYCNPIIYIKRETLVFHDSVVFAIGLIYKYYV